ncbi:ANTAR domain-containing protein [Streptomyces venezuelae]|uniref:ANTAR domain-containing protein n=1 Tax=Streptomyces venezuelae TaxID=54571 RepID=UPI0034544DAE
MTVVLRCTAEEAWGLLVEACQHHNTKLRDIATHVTSNFTGREPMLADVRQQLKRARHACIER